MINLPAILAARYRPATEHEVRSWSFGRLTVPRRGGADSWQEQIGTLDDQRIFGPVEGFACACGKYRGSQHRNMICDRCGVKVTTPEVRRRRFGHIELSQPLPHPMGSGSEQLGSIPVLPAAFVCSTAGEPLAPMYDRLIEGAISAEPSECRQTLDQLFALLVPVVVLAHSWDLEEAPLLARGLSLECRIAPDDACCGHCGYPIAGLDTPTCPGCGWPTKK
jgi:hypothetical protein